ncbi:MAG: OmpH family outer membrane protein [Alphaproteobacteria bacterium]|nr:OmpH family outer membrane protein [Alphaproteobacteria bacterium]
MNNIMNVKNISIALLTMLTVFLVNNVAFSQEIPVAKIIVIDNRVISTNAAVAKDINRQTAQIKATMEAELQTKENALRAEQEDLKTKINIIPQESYNQLQQAFQVKVNQYQQEVQIKSRQLETAIVNANNAIERELKPILQKILKDTGATMMLDKNLIREQIPGLDVTTRVIEQLDLVMPSTTVSLPPLPEAAPAAGAAAPQEN